MHQTIFHRISSADVCKTLSSSSSSSSSSEEEEEEEEEKKKKLTYYLHSILHGLNSYWINMDKDSTYTLKLRNNVSYNI